LEPWRTVWVADDDEPWKRVVPQGERLILISIIGHEKKDGVGGVGMENGPTGTSISHQIRL
jgi:hypothetical protein